MIRSIFIAVLMFCLWGCSSSDKRLTAAQNPQKVRVLSTTAIVDNLVAEIGGNRIEKDILIVGELDPHSYELVKGDDEKILSADIIFGSGLGLEHGASLRYQLEHHQKVVFLGEEIRKTHSDKILELDGQVDPHIWMDAGLWKEAISPIAKSLAKLDPEGEAYYLQNAAELEAKMDQLHGQIFAKMQQVPAEKRFLVATHDAFQYFTRAYLATSAEHDNLDWKRRCASPEGLAPEGQLSAIDIRIIVDYLQTYKVSVIFPESNVNQDSLVKIASVCKEKGFQIKLSPKSLYSDALGDNNSDAKDYFSMMLHNAEVLSEEWE